LPMVPDPARNPGLVADCAALLKLGIPADVNWSLGRPLSEWTGVTVSGNPPRVTRLILNADSRNPGSLRGSIPASIGELSKLRILSLRGNGLSGAIPAELANLSNLRRLYLAGNDLCGSIPPDLRSIRFNDLDSLELSECSEVPVEPGPESPCANGTAVPNPADNPALVADCETLLGLKETLAGTTGTLNWSDQLAIDSWDGITASGDPLRVTEFVYDREYRDGQWINWGLNGQLPAQLGDLDALERLVVTGQELTGSIPTALGNLVNLRFLNLWQNNLSGAFPPELGTLTQLERLDLPGGISGCIPHSIADGAWTTGPPICNEAPEFWSSVARRSIGENASAGAALQHAVTANDYTYDRWGNRIWDEPLTYSLSDDTSDPANADAASFTIDQNGVLHVGPDTDLDYDRKSSYTVVVQVSDGKNRYNEPDPSIDDSITVTIEVLEEVEPVAPASPGALSAAPTLPVSVSWGAAAGQVTGYEVQYRIEGRQPQPPWVDHPHSGLGTSTRISGLEVDADYTIRVRAVGPGGASGWTEFALILPVTVN